MQSLPLAVFVQEGKNLDNHMKMKMKKIQSIYLSVKAIIKSVGLFWIRSSMWIHI